MNGGAVLGGGGTTVKVKVELTSSLISLLR